MSFFWTELLLLPELNPALQAKSIFRFISGNIRLPSYILITWCYTWPPSTQTAPYTRPTKINQTCTNGCKHIPHKKYRSRIDSRISPDCPRKTYLSKILQFCAWAGSRGAASGGIWARHLAVQRFLSSSTLVFPLINDETKLFIYL